MRPWGGGGTNWKVQWYKKTSVGYAIVCFRHLCFWLYYVRVHLSLLSFEKTFVFEANMCVGSRHQQGLISAQMTDGKRQWEDNRGGELQHYGGNKKSHQIRPGPQTESQKELFHLKKTLEECETAIASQCWCWEWGRSWGRKWDPFWCGWPTVGPGVGHGFVHEADHGVSHEVSHSAGTTLSDTYSPPATLVQPPATKYNFSYFINTHATSYLTLIFQICYSMLSQHEIQACYICWYSVFVGAI